MVKHKIKSFIAAIIFPKIHDENASIHPLSPSEKLHSEAMYQSARLELAGPVVLSEVREQTDEESHKARAKVQRLKRKGMFSKRSKSPFWS